MDRNEANRFIDSVLGGLWPDWAPSEEETYVWFKKIGRFDYETARTAAQDYFADAGGHYKRPQMSGIVTKAQVILQNQNVGRSNTNEPVLTTVFVECLEPPERNPKLEGKRKAVYAATDALQSDKDHVLRCAETMRKAFERLYGGKWITVATKPAIDNGLRGDQARQKAFRDILQGEDTKTKRWLMGFLENEQTKETKEIKPPMRLKPEMAGVL